jgi:hypothetical protein
MNALLTESCGNETNIPSLVVEGPGVGGRSENSHTAVATSASQYILSQQVSGGRKCSVQIISPFVLCRVPLLATEAMR